MRWPKCGIRLEFGWNSAGIRLEFDWNSTGIRLEFDWNSAGIRGLQTRESMREDEAPKLAARVDRAQLSAPPDRRALSFAVSPCALRSLADVARSCAALPAWERRHGPLAHFAYIATVANTVLFSRRTRASRLPRVWVRVRVALQAKHSDSGGCL